MLNVQWKDWCWSWNSTLAPDTKNWLTGKDPDAGKDWRQEEKGATEDETVGWHHRLNDMSFSKLLGVGDGQGSLVCCSPWGLKESDITERQNNKKHLRSQRIYKNNLWENKKISLTNTIKTIIIIIIIFFLPFPPYKESSHSLYYCNIFFKWTWQERKHHLKSICFKD